MCETFLGLKLTVFHVEPVLKHKNIKIKNCWYNWELVNWLFTMGAIMAKFSFDCSLHEYITA